MITDDLAALITQATLAARDAGEFTLSDENMAVKLETPGNKQFGDYSCNIALTLKKATGINNSRDIAERILRHLPQENPLINRVEIAGPGFMNFYLKPTWLQDTLVKIETEDRCYGTSNARNGEKILIEFVSANPTGPISVVNGRAAALGDVLGNLLASQGCAISREFYINDALNSLQLEKFGETVMARYLQQLGHPLQFQNENGDTTTETQPGTDASTLLPPVPFPANGYRGEYVKDIARSIIDQVGNRYAGAAAHALGVAMPDVYRTSINVTEARDFFRKQTLQGMIAVQKAALDSFGLHYDTWFYESSLYELDSVEKAIAIPHGARLHLHAGGRALAALVRSRGRQRPRSGALQ